MKLPKNISITIQRNPHAVLYQTADEYIRREELSMSDEDLLRVEETGELWVAQWYPETPVGSCVVASSSFERLAAILGAQDGR